jgi:anthranilate phosphoribosyltransferase
VAPSPLVGVFSENVIDLVAATLSDLGVERAFVVHGAGGLDEISLSGKTMIAEVRGGTVKRFTVTPEDFGVARAPLESIRGGTAAENAALIRRILEGEGGPPRDIVVVNAAAALVAAGLANNFLEAAGLASFVISSGAASEKLASLAAFTSKS